MQIKLDALNNKTILPETKAERENSENFVSYLQPEKKSSTEKVTPKRDENNENKERANIDEQKQAPASSPEEKSITADNSIQNNQDRPQEIIHALRNTIQQQDIQLKSFDSQAEATGISLLNSEQTAKTFKALQTESVLAGPKIEISALALQKMEIKPVDKKVTEVLTTENKPPEKSETITLKNQQPPASKDLNHFQERREHNAEVKPDPRPKLFLEKEVSPLPLQAQSENISQARIYFMQPAAAGEHSALQQKILNDVQNAIQFLWQRGEDKILIKLFPPELGRVQIELIRKDQAIEIRISTENQSVREIILSNSEQLRQNLQNSGIQLRNFEVNIGNFREFFLNSQQNQQHPAHRERDFLPDYGPANHPDQMHHENPTGTEKIFLISGRINILI